MKIVDFRFMASASAIGAVRKHFAKSVHRLALPPAHLIRVHLMPGCDLLDRPVATKNSSATFTLKSVVNRRRVVIPYSSVIRWNTP